MKNNPLLLLLLLLLFAPSLFAQVSGLPTLPATSSTLGSVQPDNTSITVSPAGVLSAVSTPAAQYIAPQAISGCGVEYVSGLTYTIGACAYSINGIVYHSALTNITLSAADPTNPRIDVIFVDTTQVVQKITGLPAVTPQQPVVDPSTQLQLTFILVPATGTTPSNTTTVAIYQEGTEWTGSTGGTNSARVNLTSTNNPYLGTHDTEFGVGGTVATTTYAQYLDPAAGTVNMSNYNALVFYVRNKAAWASTRSVTVQWYNGATPTGIAVVLSNGAFGFNATTNTSSYQQVSIPVSTFGIPGVPVTSLRFTVSGSGTAPTGFYLDQVSLQGGNGSIVLPTTLMNFKGGWSGSSTYSPNDTVVIGGVGYVALAANTNVAVTTTATWAPLASGSVGTAGQVQMRGATAGSSAASAITDNGTTISLSEPIAVTVAGGQGGTFDATEGTAASATAGHDVLYADSTSHCIKYSTNGGSFTCIGVGTGTVTAVTGTSPIVSSGGTAPAISCPTCITSTPLYLNWVFNSGAAATDASPRFLASHTGTIANCYALTTASDGATALTFNIFDNGSTIFSGGAQTIAAGTAAGTLTTLGSLGTTSITNNDKISINITSGTSSWIFTVSCK